MRPVSQRFLAAVQGSHGMAARARICTPGQNGTTPDGTLVDITAGSVTLDSTAQVRGTLDLTVLDTWPADASGLLTPYGTEAYIERGVVYGDGGIEWVGQGYYGLQQVEQEDAPAGSIALAGSDRMQRIIDGRIPFPVQFAAGTPALSVVEQLVWDVCPWAVLDYDPILASSTLATAQTTTDDRYGFLNDLITSYGLVWYWDYRGYLYVHPQPSPTVPVLSVNAGNHGVLTSLSRTLNRAGLYSGCVASGQQTADPTIPAVSALVVDSDPTSPTYWYGAFGKVPQFYSSSFLTTQAQCVSAATSIMLRGKGLPYNVDFGMVPNPALEPLDCVRLVYPGRSELHTISSMAIGLTAKDAVTAKTAQTTNARFASV